MAGQVDQIRTGRTANEFELYPSDFAEPLKYFKKGVYKQI